MSGMGLKEKAVAATVVAVVLYGVLAFFAYSSLRGFFQSNPRPSQSGSWAKARAEYRKAQRKFLDEEKLIASKRTWIEAYDRAKGLMPSFDASQVTDTTWARKVDQIAEKHNVLISQRQPGKETEAGEVLELPIEVRSWEASLQALVGFLHELENTDEGMFDVRSISFKPSSKKGYLKGSLVVTCAYMRGN